MATKYTMQEVLDLNNEGKTLLYPRIINRGNIKLDRLAEMIASNATYTKGEAIGVITLMVDMMAMQMGRGMSVTIDGLGTFRAQLSQQGGNRRELTDGSGTRHDARSIAVSRVSYRTDRRLPSVIDSYCDLESEPEYFTIRRPVMDEAARHTAALQYLDSHTTMGVGDYARLCGISRPTASSELRRWAHSDGSEIRATGSGTHKVYVKNNH